MGDVEVPIKLEYASNGEHYVLSMYPLDSLQKLTSQLQQGHLVYSKRNKKTLGSTNYAPEFSPDLVRLVVAQGFTGNTITAADLVKSGGEGFSASVMTESQRREAVKNELARVAAMDKQVAWLADDRERVLGADGSLMLDFLAPLC